MPNIKSVIKSNVNLTSYKFYTDFLKEVAESYRNGATDIDLQLFENGDNDIYSSTYHIDPIVVPLLLSLTEQLSKYHKKALSLGLHNNQATIDVLEFLVKCDFFHISGNNINPNFPKGRNILQFDPLFFGSFKGKVLRTQHRVRAYSLEDDGLAIAIKDFEIEEEKRDFLMSHYTYKVRDHFQELLFDNELTIDLHNIYIDILSELITNAVLHSKSNAYALMFVDRFKTKFSISDNGVGFEISMKSKISSNYYELNSLKNELSKQNTISNISSAILNNLHTIFDTLYYSALKERHGLFDLMVTVVLGSQGYFRIHSENSQIIISNRMMEELKSLENIRNQIYIIHNTYALNQISQLEWEKMLQIKSQSLKCCFIDFYKKAVDKYSVDIKYSSLRFFLVKFRGVHIEVEIPNNQGDDNI
ncbi:MAG: hypothetical protein EOO45_00520 [Flavobacterium sp.]|nr:MAG: hypothetical protein EOO45_00520 [Flavobacterium sp.]